MAFINVKYLLMPDKNAKKYGCTQELPQPGKGCTPRPPATMLWTQTW